MHACKTRIASIIIIITSCKQSRYRYVNNSSVSEHVIACGCVSNRSMNPEHNVWLYELQHVSTVHVLPPVHSICPSEMHWSIWFMLTQHLIGWHVTCRMCMQMRRRLSCKAICTHGYHSTTNEYLSRMPTNVPDLKTNPWGCLAYTRMCCRPECPTQPWRCWFAGGPLHASVLAPAPVQRTSRPATYLRGQT